ncbi:Na/Pi cotransporter family protein [Caldanaerobacter sp.]|uniref:Na/Pi cotransporter family protein n=1 Tax=Caldanaerobacter sp. TaxID=2930036 RepID=UPI003C708BF6
MWGIFTITKGLSLISNEKMSSLMNRFAGNLIKSIFVGIVITTILQSSSMVTVITVTMANAGLLDIKSASGIIMGSNIGSTIAVQLYAFNLFKLAPFMVLIGSVFSFQKCSTKLKITGNATLGFGLVFYGLKIMELSLSSFKDTGMQFLNTNLSNTFRGIFVGIVLALILQSSNPAIAVLQVLVSSRLISLNHALPIIYGLNIGTCSEAFILSFASNKEGKKIAYFNILLNIWGTLLFLPFTQLFARLLEALSPFNLSRQVANAHTLFNLFSVIAILPFMKIILKALDKFIKK